MEKSLLSVVEMDCVAEAQFTDSVATRRPLIVVLALCTLQLVTLCAVNVFGMDDEYPLVCCDASAGVLELGLGAAAIEVDSWGGK